MSLSEDNIPVAESLMLKFLYQIKALFLQAFGSLIKSPFKPMKIILLTE